MGRDLPDLFCGPQANFRSYPAYPWRCLITIWVAAAAATYNTDEQLPPPETLKYSVVAQGLTRKKIKKKAIHDSVWTNK